jgi:predicted alpha/beta-fold hydrolase
LAISLVLNWQNDLARNYLLASFASFGIAGALSGLYFVKEVLAFSGMPVNAPKTPELIGRTKFWLRWTTVRDVLNLLVALFVTAAYTHAYDAPSQNISQSPKIESMENTMTATDTIDAVAITHHFATVNGIKYHYAEAGKGPLVVMLHGFPELWYSWRHQLAALANAGYHAVAPDLRGFGGSEVTSAVKDYSLLQHASDVKALIDQLGAKEVVIIGHDWGANLMWIMPMLYPETVKAVVSLSIPFYPAPRDPAEIRKKWSSVFTNFEKKGVVEAEQAA